MVPIPWVPNLQVQGHLPTSKTCMRNPEDGTPCDRGKDPGDFVAEERRDVTDATLESQSLLVHWRAGPVYVAVCYAQLD